ncbi:MAG: malate synthase A [Gammaproteobacteria bacterium]|nr:malate synthase A [Gammaproteobacteria bacterium]
MNATAEATRQALKQTRIQVEKALAPGFEEILSPEALVFVEALQTEFGPRLAKLLAGRKTRQAAIDSGYQPDFLEETAEIRYGDWQILGIPEDLKDRRVEITGPTDRKMVINALNSGAKVFMADLEDSLAPTFDNVIGGQLNLRDANRGDIDFTAENGKRYELRKDHAQLLVRPRGLHLPEKHLTLDGEALSGALVDFGLYAIHNMEQRLENGTGLYLYLPKLEHWREAKLWADVFRFTEKHFGVEKGTIKVTVLIETLPAVFQMHEILHALSDYIVGLNCGRWDYIFSFIKTFRADQDRILPNREVVGMTEHFLRSYSQLLIKTCHRRGAFAMGGMAAQIPIKGDEEANEKAVSKVRADKLREAGDGHDGTWVAHPGLIPVAREVFDKVLGDKPNQLDVAREDVNVCARDLLQLPQGDITLGGVAGNVEVAIDYTAAWLNGNGCVPLNNLMEDAATAEIARTQLWQWHRYEAKTRENEVISRDLIESLIERTLGERRAALGDDAFANGKFAEAAELLRDLTFKEDLEDFLTLPAYETF